MNTVSLNFVDCSDSICYDGCPVDKYILFLDNLSLDPLGINNLKATNKQQIMIKFEEIISCLRLH